jgi:hypothetical protein
MFLYRLLGGPPCETIVPPNRIGPVLLLLPPVLAAGFGVGFFAGRGNLQPKARSILVIIWGFGIAFPLSYSAIT